MSFWNVFSRKPADVAGTEKLLREVRELSANSYFQSEEQVDEFCLSILSKASNNVDETPNAVLTKAIFEFLKGIFYAEAFLYAPPTDFDLSKLTLEEGKDAREKFREVISVLINEEKCARIWHSLMVEVTTEILSVCPPEAFDDDGAESVNLSSFSPSIPLYEVADDVPHLLNRIYKILFSNDEAIAAGLLKKLQLHLDRRLCLSSGIPLEERLSSKKRLIFPAESKLEGFDLIESYVGNTGLEKILGVQIPYLIPEAVRFEHTHVLAGTGHGKTQLLQHLIAGDLERALTDKLSIVVLDSHGDMLKTLLRTTYFKEGKLRDRLIYIDPTEIDRPIGLNLFEAKDEVGLTPAAREANVTASLELYEYFFDALLGAELTQRQGLLFRYLGLLLSRIPNGTIHTLREILDNGEQFRPYMETLPGSARLFFATRFFDKTFTETKKQLLTRLWGVLAQPALDRLFSSPKNTFDLDQKLSEGSIIFVNTAIDHLGLEGSAIYSRLIMTLLGQSLYRRAKLKPHERTPTYIYVDEAEPLIDENFLRLTTALRKYKGALTFAHQHLEQLEVSIRAGILSNTSVKLAGGVSHKDALAMAPDMHTTADFIQAQSKNKKYTNFAFFAKHITPHALSLPIPLGAVELLPKLRESEAQILLEESRIRYGFDYTEPVYEPRIATVKVKTKTEAKPPQEEEFLLAPIETAQVVTPVKRKTETILPPVYAAEGGGGVKHKYLEHLVKELAEARGFRASLEEVTPEADGRIDVVLVRDALRIAIEISVTTARDHELRNIEKCLSLPFTHIVMLTSHEKRRKSLSSYITDALDEKDRSRVSYLLPEELESFLDSFASEPSERVRTVKGIKVRTKVREVSGAEALMRRQAIAKVMARAMEK
jgi:Helicase HerA, central domain